MEDRPVAVCRIHFLAISRWDPAFFAYYCPVPGCEAYVMLEMYDLMKEAQENERGPSR